MSKLSRTTVYRHGQGFRFAPVKKTLMTSNCTEAVFFYALFLFLQKGIELLLNLLSEITGLANLPSRTAALSKKP